MPDEVRPIDGGLSNPAKRGRPGKPVSAPGVPNGDQNTQARTASASGGVEGSPAGTPGGRFSIIDPLDLGPGDDSADSGTRRRGRPRGKRAQKEETVSNLSALLKIERLLVTGCFFLGNIAGAPELQITEAEAAEIGEALKELSRHYPIGMSEKTIAWVNLSFAVGGVFGPRVVAIYKRPRAPGPGRVINIRSDSQPNEAAPTPETPLAVVDDMDGLGRNDAELI